MPRYRILLTASDLPALRRVDTKGAELVRGTLRRQEDGSYRVEGVADGRTIQRMRRGGAAVEQLEDLDRVGRERRLQVGKGDRYLARHG